MSQSAPFEHGDEDAQRVGEHAPGRRQRSDAALNRAKILDAARRLLADTGEVSMRSIAEAAGLGRGTVHRHFQTREELMDAVRRQALDDAESDEEDYLRPEVLLLQVAERPKQKPWIRSRSQLLAPRPAGYEGSIVKSRR
jgi:AcrR family transcriptional regulator